MGSKDLATAFDTLEARAASRDVMDPPDRIALRDHIVEIEIGAFQSERGKTQRVCFDVVVEVVASDAAQSDDVDAILSYDTLTEAIAFELAAERVNLLETLAARIAERILLAPKALRVFVRVQKLDRGPGALGVEIVRDRLRAVAHPPPSEANAPGLIVVIDEAQLSSAYLAGWITQLEALRRPLFIMVAPDFAQTPVVGNAAAQRRVDLLAYEQAAWGLAAKDGRCIVMDSRTELDHAAKTGVVAVWAPSKLVLDAATTPAFHIRDLSRLVRWFQKEISAVHVAQIGATAVGDEGLCHGGDKAVLNFKIAV